MERAIRGSRSGLRGGPPEALRVPRVILELQGPEACLFPEEVRQAAAVERGDAQRWPADHLGQGGKELVTVERDVGPVAEKLSRYEGPPAVRLDGEMDNVVLGLKAREPGRFHDVSPQASAVDDDAPGGPLLQLRLNFR